MSRLHERRVALALLFAGLTLAMTGCSRDADDASAAAAPQGKAFRSAEAAKPAADAPRIGESGSARPPAANRPADATGGTPSVGSSELPPAPAVAVANSPNAPNGAATPPPGPAPAPVAAKPQTVPEMIQANPDIGKTQGDLPVTDIDSRDGQYKPISFGKLGGYLYDNYAVEASLGKDGKGKPIDEIPAEVRALDKQKVALRGFMVPIDIKKNEARSFLLVRNRMACCFGMQVGLNEWVFVRMGGDKTARWMNDVPTTVYGTLSVGEDIRDGMIMSIYRMEGDDVAYSGGY